MSINSSIITDMKLKRILLNPIYHLYEYSLQKQINHKTNKNLPNHIGIILDGNRRYAKSIGLSLDLAYEAGSNKLEQVLEWLWDLGVKIVSVWVFSTENFNRDEQQIQTIMKKAQEKTIEIRDDKKIKDRKVQIRYSGEIKRLDESLQNQIKITEESTKNHSNHILNICLGYGGRQELTSAIRNIAKKIQSGNIDVNDIDENLIHEHLYTNGLPDPDLIIRTSGSVRLSGFMTWQSTYSELYFTDVLWPNFRKVDLLRAIRAFQARNRNYGH